MEIQGKVIQVLPEQSGISSNGNTWRVQPFVIETQEQYPKKVYVEIFGDERIKDNPVAIDWLVTAGIDIESREYNGRWYTSVRAWKVEHEDDNGNGNVIRPEDKTFDASQDTDLIF